jgi:hypothetical protein
LRLYSDLSQLTMQLFERFIAAHSGVDEEALVLSFD